MFSSGGILSITAVVLLYLYLKYSLLRKGDTLVICSLDRLSRDKRDIQKEVQYFKENEICLKVLDIPTSLVDVPEGSEWIMYNIRYV